MPRKVAQKRKTLDVQDMRGLKRRKMNSKMFVTTSLLNLKILHSMNADFHPVRLRKLPPLKRIDKLEVIKLMKSRKGSKTSRERYKPKRNNLMTSSMMG